MDTSGQVGLGYDPAVAVAHLRDVDPVLGGHLDRLGPFELALRDGAGVFLMLAEAIVYQQLSGKAAATIFRRLCALEPDGLTPHGVLTASDERLRGVGLSRAKLAALRDLAYRVDSGLLPSLGELSGMDDDEVVARLTEVRGIGRWSAEMFLIFRLGRPDVLPLVDQGIRKGVRILYRLPGPPAPVEVARLGDRWRPYRTVASWFLWRASELDDGF